MKVSNFSLILSFTVALILIYLHLSANRKVFKVSSIYLAPGLSVHNIKVLEFPPKAFFIIFVRFELL